jgi:tetraacyldisaccharide 4'-kinase
VRAHWLEGRDESWPQRLALAPLAPASWLYGAAASLHRAAYARGFASRRRLASHVVSVGGLLVGGTGKTPLAAWLAAGLHRRGRKVALASRGYGRRGDEAVSVVSDGRYVRGRAETSGDEPMLLAANAPGIPVLVGRDRGVVGLRALAAFGADVLLLDDGFQHHRLHRDVDIVSFDGELGLGNGLVLPRGPLREPARALRRADAIAEIDGPLPGDDEARITQLAPGARRLRARRLPTGLRSLRGGRVDRPSVLHGAEVGLLAAVARPRSFQRTLESLGARVVASRTFRDHHAYGPGDLRGLADEAALWVTTEKDAVKLVPSWVGRADVRVLSIELEVEDASAMLDWLESRLR